MNSSNHQIFLHIIRKPKPDDLSFSLILDSTGSCKETETIKKIVSTSECKILDYISFYFKAIHELFLPNKDIYASFVENSTYAVVSMTAVENIRQLSKFILKLLDERTYHLEKQDLIKVITNNIFNQKRGNQSRSLGILLLEMFSELKKYSSLIACFNLEEKEFLASTVDGEEENILAKEVFLELSKLEKFSTKNDDFEIKLVKIGTDVQCFWFTFYPIVIIVYAVKINVNAGIIRLKLRTWIKKNRTRFDSLLKELTTKGLQNRHLLLEDELPLPEVKNYVEFTFNFPIKNI